MVFRLRRRELRPLLNYRDVYLIEWPETLSPFEISPEFPLRSGTSDDQRLFACELPTTSMDSFWLHWFGTAPLWMEAWVNNVRGASLFAPCALGTT
jgi:hypothetical protein